VENEEFQSRLAANPELGAVVKRSGGIRNVHVAFGSADLTPKQISQLAKVVKEEFSDEKGNV